MFTKACSVCGGAVSHQFKSGLARLKTCSSSCGQRFRKRLSARERLLKQHDVDPKTGCWVWRGSTNTGGYGALVTRGKFMAAHRASYFTFVSPIPPGLSVLHRCDNPPCINPDHLFLGTQKDNMADMVSKGRRAPTAGVFNGRAKLTKEQVCRIRDLIADQGMLLREIAKMFEVHVETISRIKHRIYWKDV